MILIKQHNSQQVAHLYEHLFCMAVETFFYDKLLVPYMDYDVSARVVHGIIIVNIALNTADAKRTADDLRKLSISLDDKALHTAIIQIVSEREQYLGIAGEGTPDFEAIRQELRQIEARPWQDIDDVDLFNPQDIHLETGSVYVLKDKKELPAVKVKVGIMLNPKFADSHPELLPLFWQLATLTSESIREDLSIWGGFYSKKITRTPKHRVTKLVHLFNVTPHLPLKVQALQEEIEDSIVELYAGDIYQDLTADLRAATHADPERILPDPEYIFDRTGILLGAKGWNRIATDENCNLLLSHMKVTVSAGKQRATTSFSSLMKERDANYEEE